MSAAALAFWRDFATFICLLMSEIAFAVFYAYLLLGKRLIWIQILGAILVIAGVLQLLGRNMKSIKFDVYGKRISVNPTGTGWDISYTGGQGKSRPAPDIFIPDFIAESEIEQYLADLCHEWATDKHPVVRRID
ncbi:MAG: hypothetical protein GY850_30795 [bacterium]|nr:hypothetical protein [bacterium]